MALLLNSASWLNANPVIFQLCYDKLKWVNNTMITIYTSGVGQISTKYNMVKKSIESRIIDGTYMPHRKINSESELMKEFNVSRHTVRQAIGDLVTGGWLY